MIPLNPIEQTLKNICEAHPEIYHLHHINEDAFNRVSKDIDLDLKALLKLPFDNDLSEDDFFAYGENVSLLTHARYLPPLILKHAFFEMVYVREGSCINFLNNREYSLAKGDICIIAPNHSHALYALSDDVNVINIQMRTSTFESAFFDILKDRDILSDFFMHGLHNMSGSSCLTFRTGDDKILYNISEAMFNEVKHNYRYRGKMLDSLLTAFLIHLLREHEKDIVLSPESTGKNDDNLILMLQYIQSNYASLSLTELARFFGYSTRHISRLLKENTGKSYADIIKDLRMKNAARLLTNPNNTISSVMEAVGYTDTSTFYKAFHSYYNDSPASFRSTNIK